MLKGYRGQSAPSCFSLTSIFDLIMEGESDFDVSKLDERSFLRALDVCERQFGRRKYAERRCMGIKKLCALMEEAELRRRSKQVGVWKNRCTGVLGVGLCTARGRLRRRGRRNGHSRESRRQFERERRSGARVDYKVNRRSRARWRQEQRSLYRQSLRMKRQGLLAHEVVGVESEDGDGMEVVELVGLW